MLVKFEVRSFNLFGAIIDRSVTHIHTHIERKQYLRHSLHSLGGDNENVAQMFNFTCDHGRGYSWAKRTLARCIAMPANEK